MFQMLKLPTRRLGPWEEDCFSSFYCQHCSAAVLTRRQRPWSRHYAGWSPRWRSERKCHMRAVSGFTATRRTSIRSLRASQSWVTNSRPEKCRRPGSRNRTASHYIFPTAIKKYTATIPFVTFTSSAGDGRGSTKTGARIFCRCCGSCRRNKKEHPAGCSLLFSSG